jgi:hypothetical protein
VERLRQDRLLNPDYATRNEAAALIDELVEALTVAAALLHHLGANVTATQCDTLLAKVGAQ